MSRRLQALLPLAVLAGACATPAPQRDPAGSGKSPALSMVAERGAAPAPKKEEPRELEVVRLDAPTHPWVAFRIQFRAGSADDPPGKEGLTALCADVMAQGGTRSLSSTELNARLFPWAAELGVQTDKELTTFVARAHADHLEPFSAILAEVVTAPRWDPKELERLRKSAVDDLTFRLRTGDDESLGKEALQAFLFRGHPYGHYSGGTVQGLGAATVDECKAHVARVFNRRRLTIGLAGRVDDALVARLTTALAVLPDGDAPAAIPELHPPASRLLVVDKAAGTAAAISAGLPLAVERDDPDFFPLWLGISAFGEHRQMGGRLFDDLRGKRGLNYGDYAYAEHFAQEGWGTLPLTNVARTRQYFSIWIRPVEPKNRLFATRAMLWELDRLVKDGLTETEVSRARGFLKGYTLLFDQTDSRRLGYALDERFYGAPGHLQRFRAALDGLSAAEVNAALKRHLDPARLHLVVVTPDGAGFVEAVKSGAPTPITYASPKPAGLLAEDEVIARFPFGVKPEEIELVKPEQLFER